MILTYGKEIVGTSEYARIIRENKTLEEIALMAKNQVIFVLVNRLFHENELSGVKKYLVELSKLDIKGIIFSDLAILQIGKSINILDKLIYDPNTLLTSSIDFNFYAKEGIKGAFVSPFITLEELKLIGKNKQMEVFFLGYGHLNMMYSKRPLLTNYLKFKNENNNLLNRYDLKLKEEIRDEFFPIIENEAGTHFFSSKAFSILPYLNELSFIDYLIIDETFEENITEKFLSHEEIPNTDSGFFHKKTVLKVKP